MPGQTISDTTLLQPKLSVREESLLGSDLRPSDCPVSSKDADKTQGIGDKTELLAEKISKYEEEKKWIKREIDEFDKYMDDFTYEVNKRSINLTGDEILDRYVQGLDEAREGFLRFADKVGLSVSSRKPGADPLLNTGQDSSGESSSSLLQDEYYRIYLDGKIRVNEGDIEKKDLEAKCLEIEKKIQDICGKLADCYDEQKKYTKAEPLYQEVLPFRERTLGPYHSDTVHTRDMLGDCYYEQGEYTKAEPLYREALDIRERVGTWNYDYLSIVFTCERWEIATMSRTSIQRQNCCTKKCLVWGITRIWRTDRREAEKLLKKQI